MAEGSNNNGLYFIVGGIVVVVAFLFFFMSGGDVDTAGDAPVAEETNVTIEAAPEAPADAAPADAGAEPASN